ncbi:MAG: alpha/beta fold hydrolase, partial [Candidatus Nanopelagicales bacterium]
PVGGGLHRMKHAPLHGQDVAYDEIEGSGPVLLLVHGIGSSSRTWDTVVPVLAESGAAVLIVDLPGHGQSGKERGDYSLGASASTLRDLLDHLGHDRVVLVGHSLGGGIAMQFAYQFPDRCEGLVLVASGGLGREASVLLRAASLPGAELVLPVITHRRTRAALEGLGSALARVHMRPDLVSGDTLRTLDELSAPEARAAFLATLRGVMDRSGQRVSAISKLPTAARVPMLLVWGDRDPILPLRHGRDAAELIEGSRLVVFPGAGHEPHRFDPERFARLLSDDVVRQPRPSSA